MGGVGSAGTLLVGMLTEFEPLLWLFEGTIVIVEGGDSCFVT
jgi:hypothetical protein